MKFITAFLCMFIASQSMALSVSELHIFSQSSLKSMEALKGWNSYLVKPSLLRAMKLDKEVADTLLASPLTAEKTEQDRDFNQALSQLSEKHQALVKLAFQLQEFEQAYSLEFDQLLQSNRQLYRQFKNLMGEYGDGCSNTRQVVLGRMLYFALLEQYQA